MFRPELHRRVPAALAKQPVEKFKTFGSGRIPSLDGIRAISIAMVIGFHWLNAVTRPRNGMDYAGWALAVFNGELGVSIFFVISGFLITHLLLREREKTGTLDLRAFYVRRSFRIWPAFYCYIACVVILRHRGLIGLSTRNIIAASTFTFNYMPRVGSWWVGHTWSLSLEEQFYVLWPLAILLLSRRNVGRLAIAFLFITPAIRFAEVTGLSKDSIFVTQMWQMMHTRVDTLMYGCVIALFYDRAGFQSAVRFCERWGVTVLAAIYLLAVGILQPHYRYVPSVSFADCAQGLCVALVLVWAIRHEASLLGKMLNAKAIVHLGQISFSLYL